ncbi:PREDICTED: coiled-coil domain-containing protein 190 isoform X2 [Gavialis gangeticus]|uniref:coiled-coil domain-containing protein 190 isoform X2 n=1 Tax=Gavialis gangeticus TaxID=94835 RepID=UPI00092F6DCC|nr:PREDICTED: coiled-coil domain-containing protein 190 isoform X2 [Gavialis gangeticus]
MLGAGQTGYQENRSQAQPWAAELRGNTSPADELNGQRAEADSERPGEAAARVSKAALPKPGGLTLVAESTLQHQTGNSDIMDGAGQLSSWKHGPVHTATRAKARSSLTDINLSDVRHSIAQRLSVSAMPAEQDKAKSTGEEATAVLTGKAEASDTVAGDMMPKPSTYTGRWKNSFAHEKRVFDTEAFGPESHFRTMHTRPSFLELYAEARKARYIRHKGIPDSERELSLQEIFGHEDNLEHSHPTAQKTSTALAD